jgi:hypothetical protein
LVVERRLAGAGEAVVGHESLHALVVDLPPWRPQRGADAPHPAGLARVGAQPADRRQQLGVAALLLAGLVGVAGAPVGERAL